MQGTIFRPRLVRPPLSPRRHFQKITIMKKPGDARLIAPQLQMLTHKPKPPLAFVCQPGASPPQFSRMSVSGRKGNVRCWECGNENGHLINRRAHWPEGPRDINAVELFPRSWSAG